MWMTSDGNVCWTPLWSSPVVLRGNVQCETQSAHNKGQLSFITNKEHRGDVSFNNKMRVVTSEGWNLWPMGEDGQFTL